MSERVGQDERGKKRISKQDIATIARYFGIPEQTVSGVIALHEKFLRENGQLRRAKAHDRDVKRDPGLRRDVAAIGGDPSL